MYKFQEVLFGAEERPSEEAPKEERIAAIVAAAEASLPANVLYPTAGSITEVDARTGRALEAIWLETAEIYGSEYAPELTHRESNPLCRGIYVFDRESEKDSYTVWDNSDGYALTAYASDHGVAVKAAHMVARNRIAPTSIAYGEMSTIQDVVHDLEMNAAQRIETRFKAALEQAVEDVKRDLIESAGVPAVRRGRPVSDRAASLRIEIALRDGRERLAPSRWDVHLPTCRRQVGDRRNARISRGAGPAPRGCRRKDDAHRRARARGDGQR